MLKNSIYVLLFWPFFLVSCAPRQEVKPTMPEETTEIIEYESSKPSLVNVIVYDRNGALVRNLVKNKYRTAGNNREIWNKKDNKGQNVPPGNYTIIIEFLRLYLELTQTIGSTGSSEGHLFYPQYIALDSKDNLAYLPEVTYMYVTDSQNQRVQRFDKYGDFDFQFGRFGTDDGQFNNPSGIAVDFDHWVYVVDKGNSRVQKFGIKGDFVKSFGSHGTGQGQFDDPQGVALDLVGSIYVADPGNDRIQKFDSQGNFVLEVSGYGWGEGFLNQPHDVATDRFNNIYVADMGNNRIQRFDESGRYMSTFGKRGKGEGEFDNPSGIILGDSGYVYVADSGNGRIQVFDNEGNFIAHYDKGLSQPTGLALDRDNNLYVVDTGKNCVKRLKIKQEVEATLTKSVEVIGEE